MGTESIQFDRTRVNIAIIIFLIVSLSFLNTVFATSSNTRVQGSVKDGNGSSLAATVISFISLSGPLKAKTQSNNKGEFSIGLPAGDYSIRVNRDGYKPYSKLVNIKSARTIALDLILEVLDLKESENDPRNWDIKTLLRAAPDSRLIFRLRDSGQTDSAIQTADRRNSTLPFLGGSTAKIYLVPGSINEFSTMFALSPFRVGDTTYITVSQLNPWNNSARIKNFLDYKLSDHHLVKLSMGFEKGQSTARTYPSRLDNLHNAQAVTFSVENENRIVNNLSLIYGFGYSHLRSSDAQNLITPELQLRLTPSKNAVVKALMSSRRRTDDTTLVLPTGEVVDIGDPFIITKSRNQLTMASARHYEISFNKTVNVDSMVELGAYADRNNNSIPLRFAMDDDGIRSAYIDRTLLNSEGLRALYRKQLLDFVSGSVAYVYATGAALRTDLKPRTFSENFSDLARRGTFHLISTQIDARIDKTHSNISTVLKWTPKCPINSIDLFSNRKEVANNGINLFIRQDLPVPEFISSLSGLEALLDIRNLLDQNPGILSTNSGEVFLVKHVRSFRGGIMLKFR